MSEAIWNSWLTPARCLPYQKFTHFEYIEREAFRPEVADLVTQLFINYHNRLKTWVDLLGLIGFPELEKVYKEMGTILPSKYSLSFNEDGQGSELMTRRGNFLEILANEFASYELGFTIPIKRFQYNPNPDQSMKGDDILGFKYPTASNYTSAVLTGESKFRNRSTPSAINDVITDAYKNLCLTERPYPISMNFAAQILELSGDLKHAQLIRKMRAQLQSGDSSVQRHYLLFLGTIGQPENPFSYIDSLEAVAENLTTVNIVFSSGIVEWLNGLIDVSSK